MRKPRENAEKRKLIRKNARKLVSGGELATEKPSEAWLGHVWEGEKGDLKFFLFKED